ncbi:hypothetical protein M0R45_026446 [Rubus argutus]|uniref:Uncharacterized protein n=1 Tax=Rubus argutus TaxID=59490 RepID=A0AAW1WYV8_RUBAR
MKEDVVKDIVTEVLKALTSNGLDTLGLVKEKMPNPTEEVNRKIEICDNAIKCKNLSLIAAHARLVGSINTKTGFASAKEWNKPELVLFPLMGKLSAKDSSILNYLFSKSGIGEERWSEEVVRNGEFCVIRSELQCLLPTLHMSSKVINIAVAHLYEDDSQRWFFPTYFGTHVHGCVATTLNICQLQRFHRRLRHCRQASKHIHFLGCLKIGN